MSIEGHYVLKAAGRYARRVGPVKAVKWEWVADVSEATAFVVYEAAQESARLLTGLFDVRVAVVSADHVKRGGQGLLL